MLGIGKREWIWGPFPSEIQDDLGVETDRPSSESNPSQHSRQILQGNWIPRRHFARSLAQLNCTTEIGNISEFPDSGTMKALGYIFLYSLYGIIPYSFCFPYYMQQSCSIIFLPLKRLWKETVETLYFLPTQRNNEDENMISWLWKQSYRDKSIWSWRHLFGNLVETHTWRLISLLAALYTNWWLLLDITVATSYVTVIVASYHNNITVFITLF